jgi:hypothetical protein
MANGFRPPIPPLPPERGTERRFETFFDRKNPIIEGSMYAYVEGTHILATKQMPSALLLRKAGSPTLKKTVEQAQSAGIPVVCKVLNNHEHKSPLEFAVDLENNDQINVTEVVLNSDGIVVERHPSTYESKRVGVSYPQGRKYSYQVSYEDPFRVIAGRFLARACGMEMPRILVWPGDGCTITESIPSHLLKTVEGWKGTSGNSFKFTQILGPHIKYGLILKHTYWGRLLDELTRRPVKTVEGEELYSRNTPAVRSWARMLKARLLALLQGGPDPLWGKDTPIYANWEVRPEKHRAARFLELLKTVDGIFLQCYSAVPEEKWTWRKFEMFTLKNLSSLIGDEFFDGDVAEEYHDATMRFTELKRARKTFKSLSNMEMLEGVLADKQKRRALVPNWLGFWLPRWEYTRSYEETFQLTHADSVLCQTRGCGQPPDMVKMQSKRKFLSTVSDEPGPLSNTEIAVIRASIRHLDDEIPQEVFTGLDTKARVTINANACWENTQEEGGTLDAISEIVCDSMVGVPCQIRDLFTGEITDSKTLEEVTPGTYVFWRCLSEVLKQSPTELRKAALVMISEPGKGRTVTKATAALKIVLDVVNKICSHPLSKIQSSKSGMGKSSHAWNSFKSAWTAEGKDYVFAVSKETRESRPDGSVVVTRYYKDMWNSSTDYEEATDSTHHEVARELAKYWMKKCVIPPILQAIVNGTCYVPRAIVFEAHGSMSAYGSEWNLESPFSNPRFVMLRRGILMGDPLTKVILHLVNILVRITGANYASPHFIEKVFPMESGSVVDYIKRYSKTDPGGAYAPTVAPSVEVASTSVAPVEKTDVGSYRGIPMPIDTRVETTFAKVPTDSEISELYRGLSFNLERALFPEGRERLNGEDTQKQEDNLLPERDRFLKFENLRIAALLRSMELERRTRTEQTSRDREAKRIQAQVANMRFDLARPTTPVVPARKPLPQSRRKGKRIATSLPEGNNAGDDETVTCFDVRKWFG